MSETEENIKIVEGSDGYLKEVDGEIVPNYDATINIFSEGDIVTGSVVRIDKDEVLVDIGYKSEGVIPVSELSIRKSVNTADEVTMGEEIDALVMQKEDADGRLILSKKRARFEKAWKRIEAAHESGEPVQGTVIEVVKGGLILDLGVRGFLPASLVDIRRVQDLGEYVSQQISCRVIEMNRNRNNVVLSRRAVLEEERKEVRQQIIDELNVGDIVEGTISNIVDFGAFVDLDGIDGLIHISELSWTHINHPSEVLQVNQKVKVKVLDIDRDRQRISLGLKQTQADPWEQIVSEHNIGDVIEGKVTKIVAFGAFVEIHAGIEGLVHISELANRHVERSDEVVTVGQAVPVKIIEIDSDRRRLSLSVKRVAEGEAPVMAGEREEEVEEPEAAGEAEEVGAVEAEAEEIETEVVAEGGVAEPQAEAVAEVEESAEEAVTEEPQAEEPQAEEPEPQAEEPQAEPMMLDEMPSLGLSDEVFPAGAELAAREEAEAEAEAETTPAEAEAETTPAEAEAEATPAEAEAEATPAEAEAEATPAEAEAEATPAEAEAEAAEPEAEAAAEVAEIEPAAEAAEAEAETEPEDEESAKADA